MLEKKTREIQKSNSFYKGEAKKNTWNWLEHYTTIFLLFFRSSWNGGQWGQTCKRRGVNCSNNSRPPLPQEYYFSVTRSIVLYFFEIPARLWHCVQLASSISRITCVRNRLWVSLALKMWFLLPKTGPTKNEWVSSAHQMMRKEKWRLD